VTDYEYRISVGIDWATEAHQACVLDCTGPVLAERSFAHTGEAVAGFAQWLHEIAGGDPRTSCHRDRGSAGRSSGNPVAMLKSESLFDSTHPRRSPNPAAAPEHHAPLDNGGESWPLF
jgi:hypothetical protein